MPPWAKEEFAGGPRGPPPFGQLALAKSAFLPIFP